MFVRNWETGRNSSDGSGTPTTSICLNSQLEHSFVLVKIDIL
jgi:hypothetical protein